MKIVIVSGGFDPIHSGHLAYLNSAKNYGDMLIVALNSDEWLIKKKGKAFMPYSERNTIIQNISCVDRVIDFKDDEFGSASNAIKKVKEMYPNDEIFFANGGDRKKDNTKEMDIDGVKFIFSVGGNDKKNSSSWILKEWQYDYEKRIWGSLYNLFKEDGLKVKELIVAPRSGMSFQRHFKRSELWLVSEGSCVVNYSTSEPDKRKSIQLNKFDHYFVPLMEWHQITNPFDKPCHIIEIQYGHECTEDDIERLEYYSPKP